MADRDLDDFKQWWKGHDQSAPDPLDDRRLSLFLRSSSGTLGSGLLRNAWFDFALKAAILATLILAFLVSSNAREAVVPFLVVWFACAVGLVAQLRVIAAIPRLNLGSSTTVDVHRKLVDFYERHALMATLVQSMTGPLLFVTGTMLFFLWKYAGFPQFDHQDFMVFGSGTLLSFALSFFPLRGISQRQRRYITANLSELEGDELDADRISAHRSGSNRLFLMLLILVLSGLAVLFYFIIGRS